jgi:hypothetical protein
MPERFVHGAWIGFDTHDFFAGGLLDELFRLLHFGSLFTEKEADGAGAGLLAGFFID